MRANYIKVVLNGKKPFVALASNKSFFMSRGAKIEEPTEKEIIAAFPNHIKRNSAGEKQAHETAKSELASAKEALEKANEAHSATLLEFDKEKQAHETAKSELASAKEALEKANEALKETSAALEGAKTEIEKLKITKK